MLRFALFWCLGRACVVVLVREVLARLHPDEHPAVEPLKPLWDVETVHLPVLLAVRRAAGVPGGSWHSDRMPQGEDHLLAAPRKVLGDVYPGGRVADDHHLRGQYHRMVCIMGRFFFLLSLRNTQA